MRTIGFLDAPVPADRPPALAVGRDPRLAAAPRNRGLIFGRFASDRNKCYGWLAERIPLIERPRHPRRAAMVQQLVHLPYIGFWLPVLAAMVVAVPLFWLIRPRQATAAPPEAIPSDPDLLVTKHASEQRRSFRRGGNSIGVLYKRPEQGAEPQHASVIDRSLGGLCLMGPELIPTGTVLAIRPVNSEEIIPWVEIEVCTCRPRDDSFEIGCRFVKTPPYSILLLFG
jgi:PilZ domain